MKLRKAVGPSCIFVLVLVAVACGGSSGSDVTDPFLQGDASGSSGTSGATSGGTSGAIGTSGTSGGTSGGTGGGTSGGTSGGPIDSGADDADVADASSPDATPPDAGSDASDGGGGGIGIYVSTITGQAGNPGTKDAPLKTIAQGITNAIALGGAQTVIVGEGTYAEKVTLVEGISLRGGHECNATSCTWAPNANLVSSIVATDAEGVLAGKTVTRQTTIEGFRIRGRDGSPGSNPNGAAITIDGGSPIVRNNTITPGAVNGASGRAVGIAVYGPPVDALGPLIEANTIAGGSASTVWAGISLDRRAGAGASAVAQIVRNTIRGGNGTASFGISAGSSVAGTVISNNDIAAGTATGGGGSWGIQVSSNATIDRNRINLPSPALPGIGSQCNASTVCGGIISQSSTSVITNNVVFGVRSSRSAAVLLSEAEGPPGPVVLNGNYLDGAGLGILSSAGTTISTAVWLRICQGNACGVNAVLGRLRNDIFAAGVNENRYGIYEEHIPLRTAHPDKLESNDFYFPPLAGRKDSLYHFWNGTLPTDLATTAAISATVPTTPPPSGLLDVDPLVNATFHLTDASPMIDKGTAADAPAADMDAEARPKNGLVDIGPDEAR